MALAFDCLRVLATCSSVMLAVSPWPDFWRVHHRQSPGELSLLPVVLLFCNAYLWCVYGCVADSIFPLVVVNLVGVTTSLIFSAVFYRWSSTTQRRYVLKLWLTAAFAMLVATMYAVVGVHGATNQAPVDGVASLGIVCVTANLGLFAAPLETVGVVVRTRSAASLPVSLCVANLVSGALWSAMAIGQNDMFVLVPNAIGTVLSAVQVALYVKYPPPLEVEAETELRLKPMPVVIDELKSIEIATSKEVRPTPTALSPLLNGELSTSPFGESYGLQGVVAA